MFVLRDVYEAVAPVVVRLPGNDGKPVQQRFLANFRIPSDAEIRSIIVAHPPTPGEPQMGDVAVLRACWVGWSEVEDDSGQAVPWSAEARDRMLAHKLVRQALIDAFLAASTGRAEKN